MLAVVADEPLRGATALTRLGEPIVPISDEVVLSFDWSGLKLAGSLHLPSGAGPHPAVVMAQGSGPADRDSGGYFESIRKTFIDRGIATFAFDKPGCGVSSGDWRHYGLEDRAEQLVAAFELVRNQPAITGEKVGIYGHSQGGWLVQKLAGRHGALAFALASSGPTIGIEEQILYDCEQAVRSHGHDQHEIRDALTLTRALHTAAAEGADFESISGQLLEPASLQPWYDSCPTIDDAGDWEHVKVLIGEPHEPLSDLKRITCPFLAVYGGLDTLLPPWQGAEESGRALAAAESPDVTVVVFPLGDHRLQDPASTEFVDGYLDLLGDWAANRAH